MALRSRGPRESPYAARFQPESVDRWLQVVTTLMSVAALLFIGGIGYQVASGWEMRRELEAARELSRDIEDLRREAVVHNGDHQGTGERGRKGRRPRRETCHQIQLVSRRVATVRTLVVEKTASSPKSGFQILELLLEVRGLQ